MNFLIAGLGNIGAEYSNTRHNMGFMVLDAWAKASNAVFTTSRYGDIAKVRWKGHEFTLLKPSTYMNLSGNAVRYWMNSLDIPLERLVVICDDLNLPFGSIRMKKKGSDGGHNGLRNIAELLESSEWTRIRLGIGNDYSNGEQIDFVLGNLKPEEAEQVPEIAAKVIAGIKDFAAIGPDRAMNLLNIRKKDAEIK